MAEGDSWEVKKTRIISSKDAGIIFRLGANVKAFCFVAGGYSASSSVPLRSAKITPSFTAAVLLVCHGEASPA